MISAIEMHTRTLPRIGAVGPHRQQGVVLLVALVFLILLSLLALSSSSSSLLQEKMVGSTRNAQLARFGADAALRQAETRLWSARTLGNTGFVNCRPDGSTPCYPGDPRVTPSAVTTFRTGSGWITAGAQVYSQTDMTKNALGSAKLAANPVYIIEDLGPERPPGAGLLHESGPSGGGATGFENHLYRITARSQGGNSKVIRVMQSVFAAKAN